MTKSLFVVTCRALLLMCVVSTVACEFPREVSRSGSEPRTPIYKHDNTGGWSVAPDGRLLALTVPEDPANEVIVLNLADETGWRLKGSHLNVKLAHPAFSPDGKLLALVATPSPYFGVGKILIVELPAKVTFVLAAEGRSYAHPAFFADGKSIAYFRDVHSPNPTRVPLGQREWLAYSVFRSEIGWTDEVQLTAAAFGGFCGVLIGLTRVHYCASDVKEEFATSRPGQTVWLSSPASSALSKLTDNVFSYVIDPDKNNLPVPFAPEGLMRAFPVGFMPDGRIVFRTSNNFRSQLHAFDGSRVERLRSLSAPNVADVKIDALGNTYWRLESVVDGHVNIKMAKITPDGAISDIRIDQFSIEAVALQFGAR